MELTEGNMLRTWGSMSVFSLRYRSSKTIIVVLKIRDRTVGHAKKRNLKHETHSNQIH